MCQKKIIGIALVIIGIVLLFWGYQMSESLGSQLSKTLTGSFSDKVMWTAIGGIASVIVGTLMIKK